MSNGVSQEGRSESETGAEPQLITRRHQIDTAPLMALAVVMIVNSLL